MTTALEILLPVFQTVHPRPSRAPCHTLTVTGTMLQITDAGHEANDSLLTVALLFSRQYSGYVVNTFIPITVLIAISFLTFCFHQEDFTNRVMVTLSVLIVLASLFSQTSSNLPQTSYVKCIDLVFLFAIVLISLVITCHIILSVTHRSTVHTAVKALRGVPSKPRRRCCSLSSSSCAALTVCCCAVIIGAPVIFTHCCH